MTDGPSRDADWGVVVRAVIAEVGFLALLAWADIRSPARDEWIVPAVVGSAFVLAAVILGRVGPNLAWIHRASIRIVAQIFLWIVMTGFLTICAYAMMISLYAATGHFEP